MKTLAALMSLVSLTRTLSAAEIETLHGEMLIGDEIPTEAADEPA